MSSWNSIWLGNKMATFKVVAYGMEVVTYEKWSLWESWVSVYT